MMTITAIIAGLAAAGLAGYYFLFSEAKRTKLKLKWAAHQLIFSGRAYEWWKLKASEIEKEVEMLAANGWTGYGVELQGRAMWWPKDRMVVSDFKKFMRDQVDALEPLVGACRKRGMILKVIGINTNGDLNKQVRQTGIVEDSQNYLKEKYGTDGIMFLPCSEKDGDTLDAVRSAAIGNGERLFPKEQTVAYAQGRGDCAFTEHHPATPSAIPGPRSWNTLVVSDNGGTLRHMHSDGVTGNTLKEAQAEAMFAGWIDSGVSVDLYAFWTSIKGKEAFLKRLGKRFEAKHGSRRA